MRKDPRHSSSLHEASRRIIAFVVVISGHLGLLIMVLRPPLFHRHTTPIARNKLHVLTLRFFSPPQLSSAHPSLPIAPSVRRRKTPSAKSPPPLTVDAVAQPQATQPARTPIPDTSEKNSFSDGGFQARLQHAQDSRTVRGVPGSDTPFAPGIHLVDPMRQGISAVMRQTQRAFGIANRHCIDVDVWRHLTPQELSQRHISPRDVDDADQKYDCNAPPGLHF